MSFIVHPNTEYLHKRVLLKRPPLVRSSSPCKQDKKKKTVRFCDNALENVRLFLKTQMPKACKADPIEDTFQLKRLNPWFKSMNRVQLEHINLVHEDNLLFVLGTVLVSNQSFEKSVEIRYTLDHWQSSHQSIYADYKESLDDIWDRFEFKLSIPKDACLQLAIRCHMDDTDYWDNNQSNNYQFYITQELDDDDLSSDEDEDVLLSPPLSPTAPVDSNPLYQHYYFNSFLHFHNNMYFK